MKLISSKLEMLPTLSREIQRQVWWGVYSDNFIPFALEIGTRREDSGEQQLLTPPGLVQRLI